MEAAEDARLAHQGLHQLIGGLPAPGIPGLDVVRALHQTVISLRSALDSSREELRRLREIVGDFHGESYADVVERLSLENHVLRRRILDEDRSGARKSTIEISSSDETTDTKNTNPPLANLGIEQQQKQQRHQQIRSLTREKNEHSPERSSAKIVMGDAEADKPAVAEGEVSEQSGTSVVQEDPEDSRISVETVVEVSVDAPESKEARVDRGEENGANESVSLKEQAKNARATSNQELLDVPEKDPEDASLRSVSDGDNSMFSDNPECGNQQSTLPETKVHAESENESEELDDIELIFTTDDTCRDLGLQEDLVSITENESWQNNGQSPAVKYGKTSEESPVCNGEKNNSSVEEAASSQSSSIDREESVDRFDESSNTRLNKMWSQCSVLVETDISKCGVVEEPEHSARHAARRNTLAAPPTAYRPIIHREALAAGRRKSSAPLRPVMDRSCGARRESGAQTDISALPAQWRSESYLAHKVAHTFTTLPSKFALPAGVAGRLRLSDKTREARRVMLSDISFTSMVPELSRSADHLCHDPHSQNCFNARGCGLRTPEVNRRESLGSPAGYWPARCNPGTGLPSPCDCRLSTDLYSSRYRGSLSSIPSPGLEVVGGPPRRHSWRANAASFDTWRVPMATSTPRPTWSSMPSSPTHVHPPSASSASRNSKNPPKRTRSKVTFQECPMTRGSLPNLRSDLVTGENSGDSTESLIDEAEDYLRRSIDSMLTISSSDYWSRQTARRRRTRRHSEPDLFREWNPPQDARPYLPKIPRDLKLDHLVKVISPEGRVLQGRVRYVGPVPGREEVHVGVELPTDCGCSDGTFHGRRFFDCEPERAIFVPFKKVVLAWCTT
ncbi:uncharacterized protein [Venturia canescens]|uniref:uncharacterized protein n=1 Tax=Venturia canescens TaxID=32260 RepID=UPI001C9CF619|nr:uncharacterized protein LOC122410651 [Venturia canescens]XP_043274899.1 uncharacterized protein LOC122410651 [Venturia canescens]XP_043274900.1 uncharacterized protein LOC122410651 [Venturia canescens]XP_043274901.1 uncharacterized protein LOC122410651 [Venturia canescens]XP_043274903.1 uncharacterized protein LOC122410651 [Venturia canescens]XP_043274904.1 uncharacterized protein LOC122410651 [Venturia canescens]